MDSIMRILEKSNRVSGGQSGIAVWRGAQKYCNRKIDLEVVQYCNIVIYKLYTLWRKKSASDSPQCKRGLNNTRKSALSLNVSSVLKHNSSARKTFIKVLLKKISHLHLNRRSSSSKPYSNSWREKKKAAGQVNILFRRKKHVINSIA
jgi:hypothetical protein